MKPVNNPSGSTAYIFIYILSRAEMIDGHIDADTKHKYKYIENEIANLSETLQIAIVFDRTSDLEIGTSVLVLVLIVSYKLLRRAISWWLLVGCST